MNKKEYIEKYGEEAYQIRSEQRKQYYQQHKEQRKQYYQQHKEQRKQYYQQHKEQIKQYYQQHKEQRKQYYQQHKEQIKQYYQQNKNEKKQYQKQYHQQHKEERKQYLRNHRFMFAFCIPEEIEQIENYWLAKESNFNGWCIHHRLETHNSDGERRLVNLSRVELKVLDMYYNRPANELIFLTISEHTKLHRKKQS